MTDHAAPERWDGTIDGDGPTGPTGAETIESYDIDGGVVFYDAENPLAWVEATKSMRLDDCA
ncbi:MULTISPECIES: hypothetical protein [Haloferax]|uniref:Uncharacterized protein n=1 Tax=Haloferax marinum TaxID=2666143 RepID=A0A6A8G721_9EURY|nr:MULTISPECIES: hypothetical protein [Haloferax]KAB1196918.1 hypothetical protein Hfx1150_05035 [Haloferax sp. CBA1150]MRW95936.1 hypothetical protein [Haloferax marinum]